MLDSNRISADRIRVKLTHLNSGVTGTLKKVLRKDLQGKQVYSNWRLDKNISWFNVQNYPLGLIYGFITFEWIRPKHNFMLPRFKLPKFWLPPIYADNYYEIKEVEKQC